MAIGEISRLNLNYQRRVEQCHLWDMNSDFFFELDHPYLRLLHGDEPMWFTHGDHLQHPTS